MGLLRVPRKTLENPQNLPRKTLWLEKDDREKLVKTWKQGHLSPRGLQTQSRWEAFLYYSDFITFASRS